MSDDGSEDALELAYLNKRLKDRAEGGKAMSDIPNALYNVEVEAFRRRQSFKDLSSRYVGGEGNSADPLAMIIGEAPGAQEDQQKRPFIGQSGLVLRQLMDSAGLNVGTTPFFGEANCWLTNVVRFRPPRNRKPTWSEVMSFRRLIRREWEIIGYPRLIIPVGGTALSAIHGKQKSILKFAGQPYNHMSRESLELKIWPMLHPAFGLREPAVRMVMERDWLKLGEWIDETH